MRIGLWKRCDAILNRERNSEKLTTTVSPELYIASGDQEEEEEDVEEEENVVAEEEVIVAALEEEKEEEETINEDGDKD